MLHSIAGEAIRATTKATTAVPAITISTAPNARGTLQLLEEARRRRQHGAGDEGHHHGQEERPSDIEYGNDRDQQQPGECESDELGAADHRRQLGMAVGKRFAFAVAGDQTFAGKDAHNISPARKPAIRAPIERVITRRSAERFHRGFVKSLLA